MDPAEFRKLRAEARRRKTSLAELIRSAVRERYLAKPGDPGPIVEAILRMSLPVGDWELAKREIEEAHAGLS
jgi:hypothetical protein